jgi:hypothetical protein
MRTVVVVLILMIGVIVQRDAAAETPISVPSPFQLQLEKIDGGRISMRQFQGKVVLVVASLEL